MRNIFYSDKMGATGLVNIMEQLSRLVICLCVSVGSLMFTKMKNYKYI